MRTCDFCGRNVPHVDLLANRRVKVAVVVNVSGKPLEILDTMEMPGGVDVCVRCVARGLKAQGRELRISAIARRRWEKWEEQIAQENRAPKLPME